MLNGLRKTILGGIVKTHYLWNGVIMDYKFNERRHIVELKEYIDGTYGEHYASDKYQATDVIIDSGHGEGFCMGNILKYAKRYGNKEGKNRKDLLKILHYAIIMLHIHDKESQNGR
jgi:hypothetical protein